jgi:prepilin-type N-terminal cleavage/methylation domain-containing protein
MAWRRMTGAAGFTLVELLVVIAIIGTLVGLLLPAVQTARESARRSTCTNNLKQIGVAIHNFESANKAFPAGHKHDSGGNSAWGWGVYILPFLEQQEIFDLINPMANTPNSSCSNLRNIRLIPAPWPSNAACPATAARAIARRPSTTCRTSAACC